MRNMFVASAAALGFAVAFLFASSLWVTGRDGPITNPLDFRAFYCAGATLAAGHDPYRVEPLRGCELAALESAGLRMDPRRVLPAPLPPYALLLFSAFAAVPYRVASELWFACTLSALSASIWAVALLARLRPLPVALSLFASLGTASLLFGQVAPVAIAGLVLAALGARRRLPLLTAAGCALAALEPHLALPAWLGLFVLVPATRMPLGLAAFALASLSLVAGPELSFEYLGTVLPEHARSEVMEFGGQYSLTSLLWTLGVPIPVAMLAGAFSYVVMLALGLVLGRALLARSGDPAYAALAPVAATLLGGPFLHSHQLAAALPLALMLAASFPVRSRPWFAALSAVVLLAIPWQTFAETSAVAARLPVRPLPAIVEPATAQPAQIAEVPYTAFVDAYADRGDRRTRLEQTLWKLPTWLALLALGVVAVRSEGRKQAVM